MFTVENFFKENIVDDQDLVEYVASNRFRDNDGNPIAWKLRPITAQEDYELRERATQRKTDRKTGMMNEVFDNQGYSVALCALSVVEPDLTDRTLQKNYKARGTASLLREMLYAGELNDLIIKVLEVSGLLGDDEKDAENQDADIDELVQRKKENIETLIAKKN